MSEDGHKSQIDASSVFVPHSTIACFCETEDVASALSQLASEPFMFRANMTVEMGSLEAAVNAYPVGRTPDILVIEHSGDPAEFERLAEVCAVTTSVIAIGEKNDVGLYRQLIAMGISDYLCRPIDTPMFVDALHHAFSAQQSQSNCSICAVFSAGGGAGASSIAQNLAIALSEQPDARVALIDLDFAYGTTTINFNVKPLRGPRDLLLSNTQFNAAELEQVATFYSSSLSLVISPPGLQGMFVPRSEQVDNLLVQARSLWDYVVIDVPSGWSDMHAQLFATCENVVVASLPTLAGYQNTNNLLGMSVGLRKLLTSPHLAVNRVIHNSKFQLKPNVFDRVIPDGKVVTVPDTPALFAKASEAGKAALEISGSQELRKALAPLVSRIVPTHSERKKTTRSKWSFKWLAHSK